MIPTVWAEPENARGAAAEAASAGWERIVVKPAIDLGAANLKVVGQAGVEEAVAGIAGASLVQPYLPSLELEGELSLVYFRGELARGPQAAGRGRLPRPEGPRRPLRGRGRRRGLDRRGRGRVRACAESRGPPRPLYARVDLVRDEHGEPCVIEVELIEPSLFLELLGDEAADRFAALLTD